jgi:hypothetical protein
MATVGTVMGTTGWVAQEAFAQARSWFKSGEKSFNKKYFAGTDAEPVTDPVSAERFSRRETNAAEVAGKIRPLRMTLPGYKAAARDAGDSLVRSEIKYGNCPEMSCVAISFAAKLIATLPDKDKPAMYYVEIPFADHALVLVGPKPEGEDVTIASLRSTGGAGGGPYIVDVWSGVLCLASEYEMLFKQQMEKWSGQGKKIQVMGTWVNAAGPGEITYSTLITKTTMKFYEVG